MLAKVCYALKRNFHLIFQRVFCILYTVMEMHRRTSLASHVNESLPLYRIAPSQSSPMRLGASRKICTCNADSVCSADYHDAMRSIMSDSAASVNHQMGQIRRFASPSISAAALAAFARPPVGISSPVS